MSYRQIKIGIPVPIVEQIESRRFEGEKFHRAIIRHLKLARRSGRSQKEVVIPKGDLESLSLKIPWDLFDWLTSGACPGETTKDKILRQLWIAANHDPPRRIDSKKILLRLLRNVVKDQEVAIGDLLHELSLRASMKALKAMLEELEADGAIVMIQRAGSRKISFNDDKRRLSVLRVNHEGKEAKMD